MVEEKKEKEEDGGGGGDGGVGEDKRGGEVGRVVKG